MKSFYFDTALSAPSGFPSLLAFAPRGHVVFGTDYPYASEALSKKFTRNMDIYDQFKTGELDEINRGARTLFPRLSKQEKTRRHTASRTTAAMMPVADSGPVVRRNDAGAFQKEQPMIPSRLDDQSIQGSDPQQQKYSRGFWITVTVLLAVVALVELS